MKLVQINVDINSGSTGRIAEEIGEVFKKQGFESYIAFGRTDRNSNSKKIKIGNKLDIMIHLMMTRLFDRHAFFSTQATKKLIKQIEIIKPDLILLHNLHGYYINVDVLFKYLQTINTPVIWTLFDCWAFTGHCSYFDTVGCEKWKIECSKCPSKTKYPASWWIDNSKLNYYAKRELFTSLSNLTIIVHSNWLKGLVLQSFLKAIPVKMIHNGINVETFSYTTKRDFVIRNGLTGFNIILGVASVWSKRKGLDDFIKLSHLINSKTRIVLVGVNKNQIVNFPANIIAIPRTENLQELSELYSSADVFVNPTYQDNFPTTNLESIACGTPVVTYNTGGSPEAIDENTGIIVEKGNIIELMKAIDVTILRGKVYYSEQCRERAIKMFNKENRYIDYLNLYNPVWF